MTKRKIASTTNLFRKGWAKLDQDELRFILLEMIGKPGQYDNAPEDPYSFYLPLAREACQIKLTFAKGNRILAIEPGPAFNPARWEQVALEIERVAPIGVGRDFSFSNYRVTGSWKGVRSGIQILPPPAAAPAVPYEMGDHPFVLEFPMVVSEDWQITNTRRRRDHTQWTLLLNILLAGHTTTNRPPQSRNVWIIDSNAQSQWLQKGYFADIGVVISDALSPPAPEAIEEVKPEEYYEILGHDGKSLRVPSDLDDSICRYLNLAERPALRDSFRVAAFWMNMASEQWAVSQSASFAALVIAIEALGERKADPNERFRDFIECYAPGSDVNRRKSMYKLRNTILHGERILAMDRGAYFGWSPPEKTDMELHEELWRLSQTAIRNWIKQVP
jgi:hypothetical protein